MPPPPILPSASLPATAPRHRDRLQIAIIINQLATPGLGSWIAGRKIAGFGQMSLAVSGFGFFLRDFFRLLGATWDVFQGRLDPSQVPAFDPSQTGLRIFAVAWIWSAVTSLQLFLELRRRRTAPLPPPKLDHGPFPGTP